MTRFALLALLLPVAGLNSGCMESVGPAMDEHVSAECVGTGTPHSSDVTSNEVWTRLGNPHHVVQTVRVSSALKIEPGAILCFAPDAKLLISNERIQLIGQVDRPILLTSAASNRPWGGIELREALPGAVAMRHIIVQNARRGVFAPSALIVDSSTFRNISGSGIAMWYYGGGITNSTFDSVGDTIFASAIGMESGTFSNNVVRNSGPVRIAVGSGCFSCRTALVDRLTIESARGTGLVIQAPNVTVRNLVVLNSQGVGVYTWIHDGLRVDSCTIMNNRLGGILVEANAVQHNCNIVGNGVGIRSPRTVTDARLNYWGSSAGPTDSANNRIEGNVLVDPFLTVPNQF